MLPPIGDILRGRLVS